MLPASYVNVTSFVAQITFKNIKKRLLIIFIRTINTLRDKRHGNDQFEAIVHDFHATEFLRRQASKNSKKKEQMFETKL